MEHSWEHFKSLGLMKQRQHVDNDHKCNLECAKKEEERMQSAET